MADAAGRGEAIAARVEAFVRDVVIGYEHDQRLTPHGPSDALLRELRGIAREAHVLTPHMPVDGAHLSHSETVPVLKAAGLSPLGPVAVNVMAPDEGNMFLLSRVATEAQKRRFLDPLVSGEARSAFFMTEPASEGGAGSDPSMMRTLARPDGNGWVINGRKAFITGAHGASVGIVMARTGSDKPLATMFLVPLPDPAIRIERVLDTIDSSMAGGHSVVAIEDLRVPGDVTNRADVDVRFRSLKLLFSHFILLRLCFVLCSLIFIGAHDQD